jgi:hypothetical protein
MTRQQMLKKLVPPTLQRPQPPKQPSPGEWLIQEKLTPLVEALVHPDESFRWAAVEHVVRICVPALVARLIDRLVDLLDGAGTARHQALASLAQFEGRALPILTLRFTLTCSVARQRGIVEALTRMAPGLNQEERIDLMIEVMSLVRFAVDESVRRGLAGLLAVARTANEVDSRTW